jgi:ATP-dependent RNA helicase RhlE
LLRARRNSRRATARSTAGRSRGACRELAVQIYDSFRTYGRHLPLKHTAIFGGVNQFRQVAALRDGVDVLVATPGRLMDLMQQGHVDLSSIDVLVLDEADRMLDMGFIRDIRKVVAELPSDRQTLLFSATMPSEIRQLADSILHQPVSIEAAPVATPVEAIAQCVYMVPRGNKTSLLVRLIERDNVGRTLVFTRTKHGADRLVTALERAGIRAHAIHSNKSQGARTRALNGFKTGAVNVLVATDIASRGIDVDEITHVFNYDLPNEPETYVHRIGRTARAGASGIAVAFCDRDESGFLRSIERLMGRRLEMNTSERDLCASAPTRSTTREPEPSARNGTQNRRRPHSRGRSTSTSPSAATTHGGGEQSARPHHGFAKAGKGRSRRGQGAKLRRTAR